MSQRSIRRAQQRKLASEQRRETLRRRRAVLATGAAIGAGALLAPAAQAAPFEVNSLGDGAPDACDNDCTLRDAITLANANGEADTITFKSGLSGTIRLTDGELPLGSQYALTINGPGRGVLSISGDADDSGTPDSGDSRIFNITGTATISGLTMTEGYSSAVGGAVKATGGTTTIQDSAVTDSVASGVNGGGIDTNTVMNLVRTDVTGNTAVSGGGIEYQSAGLAGLTISQSKISGNHASYGGGGVLATGVMTLQDSEVSGNQATGAGGGAGIATAAPLTVSGGSISGNTATTGSGGAITVLGPYSPLDVSHSVISGNSAAAGGGLNIEPVKYGFGTTRTITDTTISGNHATTGDGGGVRVVTLAKGDDLTFSHSTISGNDAPAGFGGGLMFDGQTNPIQGTFDLLDSTVSGNTARTGAGVSIGKPGPNQFICDCATIGFDNSTIASNAASAAAGGLYLAAYDDPNNATVQVSPTIPLTSTVVADNSASGAASDLDREDTSTSGGFSLSFSLVEAPGDAPLSQDPAGSSTVGSDPQLGPLADNGGLTKTHLPAQSSPVVDRGKAPARLATDQRGKKRTVDGDPANTAGGDGTDIGAVEIENPPVNPPPTPPPPPPVTPPRNVAPQAFIKKNGLGATKAKDRHASGIATDDSKVAKVQVALVYKSGGKCRDLLTKSGRFSNSHRCSRPRSFITAKGTKKWTFALSGTLAPGYYVLYARAIDDKGLKQSNFGTKSRRPFRVRKR